MPTPGTSTDPALALRFEVRVDGVDIGTFTGCKGLQAEYEVLEWQEGGNNLHVHRLPGRLKYSNVTLTRVVDDNSGRLASWFSSLQQSVSRKTASITAYDGNAKKVASWSLVGVWPVKYTGPALDSETSGTAKETLELSHNGFFSGAGA